VFFIRLLAFKVQGEVSITPYQLTSQPFATQSLANMTEVNTLDDLTFAPATTVRDLMWRRVVSAREVTEHALNQIERVNPQVNAFVTVCADEALAAADESDKRLARGTPIGPLDGIPVGVKDLFDTAGVRTTRGATIYAEHVPQSDHLIVEREKRAGAIILGKTNTPEFGAGAQTFNRVFGVTRNPYDLSKTCGGSSGGSAVALSCGMVPLADGSDFGGSLRAPAAWCNIVGMRPSPGRVPTWPTRLPWSTLSVDGPMARTVADIALFLQALAGPDPRSPIGIESSPDAFAAPLARNMAGVKVAFSTDLGYLPVDNEVAAICTRACEAFSALGAEVHEAHPDFAGASDIFKTLRAEKFAIDRDDDMREHRNELKQTIIDNVEAGWRLGGLDPAKAEEARGKLWHQVREFMNDFDVMVTPVNPVSPFPADQETLLEINGKQLETYVDWGALRHVVSIVGLPSISVPVGFTSTGLPVGLQITGRHHGDFALLQIAHAFEMVTQHWRKHPAIAMPA
jgi:amidase